jgi:hypothetical protein
MMAEFRHTVQPKDHAMKTPRFNRERQFRVAATHAVARAPLEPVKACVGRFDSRASLQDCFTGGRNEAALFWPEVQGGSLNLNIFDPSIFGCPSVAIHSVAS